MLKMVVRCRFLVSCLWFCFVVGCNYYTAGGSQVAVDDVNKLLCANDRCLTNRNRLSAILLTLRKFSHLWPLCKQRVLYLILASTGDVEMNPGPIKFPFTMCSKPVKRNQRGIQCDSCDLWTHAYCCNMGTDEYWHLSVSRPSGFVQHA